MDVRIKVYSALVNRVPGIQQRYHDYRDHKKSRAGAWLYLLKMNLSYYIFHNRTLKYAQKDVPAEKKILYDKDSESSLLVRRPPQEFADRLAEYDVISFDVFDTLIFRPFSDPTDLFYILEEESNFMDLHRLRCEAESDARRRALGTVEVRIEEIYEELSEMIGHDAAPIMEREKALEYQYCYANPYMLLVVKKLREAGKRIIVTSDMYLRKTQIMGILHRAGYGAFDGYYISCEYRKSKNTGELYEIVRKHEGCGKTIVHVGDNSFSDVEQAEKHGFSAEWYPNVNQAGRNYRAEDMSVITGGLYRGIVNAHIHNGLRKYSFFYEYGFIYGGLFVTGFCQFIHACVRQYRVDKVLFLARDGDVLRQVYERLYPGESTEYVYWSRLAAVKLAAGRNRYDYFRRLLYHKVNQGYLLRDIFQTMELEDMLEDCCWETSVAGDAFLTDKNVEKVKGYLLEHWDRVLAHYDEQVQAARRYYEPVIRNCQRVAVVDIGWAGSGILTLDNMLQKEWGMDCQVLGIMAGTTSAHDYDRNITEAMLAGGKLVSYMFSQRHNRDLWKFHDAAQKHNLYWELLLGAPTGSLKGFYKDENAGVRLEFKEDVQNAQVIREIHKGILDFAAAYQRVDGAGKYRISGRDAYAPMLLLENSQNEGYVRRLRKILDAANVE